MHLSVDAVDNGQQGVDERNVRATMWQVSLQHEKHLSELGVDHVDPSLLFG